MSLEPIPPLYVNKLTQVVSKCPDLTVGIDEFLFATSLGDKIKKIRDLSHKANDVFFDDEKLNIIWSSILLEEAKKSKEAEKQRKQEDSYE